MVKILANDGLSSIGKEKLENSGFEVITDNVPEKEIVSFINENDVRILLVRSATKVRKELIDACPRIKIIGRGGVGMDNIDHEYAREKGIQVINTPLASSISVSELVFAHLLGGSRFLHDSNRKMPHEGNTIFQKLKKQYSQGIELKGKTIGIIGLGRIGREVAGTALALGMRVIAADKLVGKTEVEVSFYNGQSIKMEIETEPIDQVIAHSDVITLHVPAQKEVLIGEKEFQRMKDGVILINCSRGGIIDEDMLIKFLNLGKVWFAGLDVFENEPSPSERILNHPKISLTPHIGGATLEAQERISIELATNIIELSENLIEHPKVK